MIHPQRKCYLRPQRLFDAMLWPAAVGDMLLYILENEVKNVATSRKKMK